jgi:hypothetical protein
MRKLWRAQSIYKGLKDTLSRQIRLCILEWKFMIQMKFFSFWLSLLSSQKWYKCPNFKHLRLDLTNLLYSNLLLSPTCHDQISFKTAPTCHNQISFKTAPTCHNQISFKSTPTCHNQISIKSTPTCHNQISIKTTPTHNKNNFPQTTSFHTPQYHKSSSLDLSVRARSMCLLAWPISLGSSLGLTCLWPSCKFSTQIDSI